MNHPSGTGVTSIKIERSAGIRWVSVARRISAVSFMTLASTMFVLAAVTRPAQNSALTLDVTARQSWWEVHYGASQPADEFDTANEIHIPVGQPVLVRVHTADAIHSFWVPQVTGKTDVIPGQTNTVWMQTDNPGRYLGRCSEFCSNQRGRMQLEVVAQAPDEFKAWANAQREEAVMPSSAVAARGLEVIEDRCALCHAVRGTDADAVSGPDLTHLMSRSTLGAGALANTRANLAEWIQDPQDAKPGSLMPNQYLSARQLNDVLAYLETLE